MAPGGKVQNLPASLIPSELSAHQMPPIGIAPHWRSRPAPQLTSAALCSAPPMPHPLEDARSMVGVPSIPSYTWSSSRCKSLGVFHVAPLLDLCLSLLGLFIAERRCSSSSSSLCCLLGFGLFTCYLRFLAFIASFLLCIFTLRGFGTGKSSKLPRQSHPS